MSVPYVPLRVFSSFTMLEGAIEPKLIAKHAAKLGFPAVALNDRNGLYAAMAFGEACQETGVQPIVGAMLAAGPQPIDWGTVLGFVAVVLASVNVFGGFLVTQRMLEMFKKKDRKPSR